MTNSDFQRRIIVTGGAGFIGSNLLRYLVPRYPAYLFVNVDCLTYAGNLASLSDIENAPNYRFERVSICDRQRLGACFEKYIPHGLFHLAAETHVDRSIDSPANFVSTNVTGTFNLLELAREVSRTRPFRFHHVSTDEVFGSIPTGESAVEESRYHPNSPYSATKAASDHLVQSYHVTFGMDTVISRSSNNYGPYQFPEKLIPLMVRNARDGKPLPVYGDGKQIRDWVHVEDHCCALDLIFHKAPAGSAYNVSGSGEVENIAVVRRLCRLLDERLGGGPRERLITFVADRPGHDRRYSLDSGKLRSQFGWEPEIGLDEGLRRTVDWYMGHGDWLQSCLSGEYQQYYERVYGHRS